MGSRNISYGVGRCAKTQQEEEDEQFRRVLEWNSLQYWHGHRSVKPTGGPSSTIEHALAVWGHGLPPLRSCSEGEAATVGKTGFRTLRSSTNRRLWHSRSHSERAIEADHVPFGTQRPCILSAAGVFDTDFRGLGSRRVRTLRRTAYRACRCSTSDVIRGRDIGCLLSRGIQ